MLGFSKKIFVAYVLSSVSFVVNAEGFQKVALEKFLATSSNVQVVQKENTVQELLNLFDKIVEGLKDGGERLSKITTAFYDLCAILGKIDEPRPHHVRELETKIEEIYVLISNDADISPTERVVLGNISSFINLFEVLLNSENLNLGGAVAKFVDLFFYKPLEFIGQFKYGPEIAATTATVVVAGLGSVIAWKVSKKKEAATNVVNPTTSTTSSKDDELEIQDFSDLAPKPDATNSTIDLTVPSSESGVDVQSIDNLDEQANDDSSDFPLLSATQVVEASENVEKQEMVKPVLFRQNSVADLQPLIDEAVKQATPKVVEEKKEEPVITTRSHRESKRPLRFPNDQTNSKNKNRRGKK